MQHIVHIVAAWVSSVSLVGAAARGRRAKPGMSGPGISMAPMRSVRSVVLFPILTILTTWLHLKLNNLHSNCGPGVTADHESLKRKITTLTTSRHSIIQQVPLLIAHVVLLRKLSLHV